MSLILIRMLNQNVIMRCPLARSMRFWRVANNIDFINLNPEYECKAYYASPSKVNRAMVQHLSAKVNIYHRIMLRFIELMSNSADVLDDPKEPTQVKLASQANSDEELSPNKDNKLSVTSDTTVPMNNTSTGTVAKSVYSTEETTNSPTKDSNSGGEDSSSASRKHNIKPSDTIVSIIITSPVILDINDSKNDDNTNDDDEDASGNVTSLSEESPGKLPITTNALASTRVDVQNVASLTNVDSQIEI